jgi:hypothetical protein
MPKKMVYPRHAKAFAKPIRLDPVGRRQVGASKRIRNYVDGFKMKGLKGLGRLWAKRSAAGACFFTRAFC